MNHVLNQYSNGDNLEVRYYLDPRINRPPVTKKPHYNEQFLDVVRKILTRFPDFKIMNVVHVGFKNIKKIVLIDHTKRSVVWLKINRKAHLIEQNNLGGFKIIVEERLKQEPVKLTKIDNLLAKKLLIFDVGEWYFEISCNKICQLDEIQTIKSKIIQFGSIEDILKNWNFWDFWEFKYVWQGSGAPQMELRQFYKVYELLAPHIDFGAMELLSQVACIIRSPLRSRFEKLDPLANYNTMLPKALELSVEEWHQAKNDLTKMIVRDKIDGRRELLIFDKNGLKVLSSAGLEEFDEAPAIDTCICDCEYLSSNETWYILHPLVWNGVYLCDRTDSEALRYMMDNWIPISGIEVCPWQRVSDPEPDITNMWSSSREYPRDGLILTTNESYWEQKSYKWKPSSEATIDFLIVKCPRWLVGKAPYVQEPDKELYLLCCKYNLAVVPSETIKVRQFLNYLGVEYVKQVPWPFMPIDQPSAALWYSTEVDLHGLIGEFKRQDDQWHIKRIRTDKPSLLKGGTDMGNGHSVVLSIWKKYKEPFELKSLWSSSKEENPLADYLYDYVDWKPKTTLLHFVDAFGVQSPNKAYLTTRTGIRPIEYKPYVYDQIAKVSLDGLYLGGAELLITADPEILLHFSCLVKLVAYGGDILVITLVKRELFENYVSKHNLILFNFAELPTGQTLLHLKKPKVGHVPMTLEEVRKENPHLRETDYSNYTYKFGRNWNWDLGMFRTKEATSKLQDDSRKGLLLMDIEYILGLTKLTKEKMRVLRLPHEPLLEKLFPTVEFLDSCQDVEFLISHLELEQSLELLEKATPHHCMMDVFQGGYIPRGRHLIVPMVSDRMAVQFTKLDMQYVRPEMFVSLLQNNNLSYRHSCFQYELPTGVSGKDHCYDCKAENYILGKYASFAGLTLKATYSALEF